MSSPYINSSFLNGFNELVIERGTAAINLKIRRGFIA